jgi:hypothetical protein
MRNRKEGVSMATTIKLLRVVGSPFTAEQKQEAPENSDEALELYTYATKNKIGLLYLETLKNQGKLEVFRLKSKYEEEKKKHDEQLITAGRISELFNLFGINYAIFKSIMPFPATPNDVDIIHFGSDEEYKKAAEIMLRSGYIEVKGQVDAEQRMFHDARESEHLDPNKKDIYDIDIYQRISASYVQYLDKRKLEKYVTEIKTIPGDRIKVLRPEAELVTIIIHSIIPEQLCTLFVFYATLHYIIKMNSEEINKLIYIAKENKVVFSVNVHFSLVAELHKAAYGFVPREIEEVLAELDGKTSERKNLFKNNFKMPHRYSWSVIIRTLLEKMKEEESRRSIVKQAVSMLNPKLIKFVIDQVIERRRRETY